MTSLKMLRYLFRYWFGGSVLYGLILAVAIWALNAQAEDIYGDVGGEFSDVTIYVAGRPDKITPIPPDLVQKDEDDATIHLMTLTVFNTQGVRHIYYFIFPEHLTGSLVQEGGIVIVAFEHTHYSDILSVELNRVSGFSGLVFHPVGIGMDDAARFPEKPAQFRFGVLR